MTTKRSGFSLFEVLIAFAVLSLVLVALIPGQAQLLSRATQSEQQSLAMDYALSRAALLGVTHSLNKGQVHEQYREWTIVETT
ncbi:prepilin-type N-terminal cleavage/methylation domain-containing protein, partial [Litoreibacter sp.]|nr:prepilin-type N-terminal cleavage/methylation domain-containing protein [Litoreibacter sp.]